MALGSLFPSSHALTGPAVDSPAGRTGARMGLSGIAFPWLYVGVLCFLLACSAASSAVGPGSAELVPRSGACQLLQRSIEALGLPRSSLTAAEDGSTGSCTASVPSGDSTLSKGLSVAMRVHPEPTPQDLAALLGSGQQQERQQPQPQQPPDIWMLAKHHPTPAGIYLSNLLCLPRFSFLWHAITGQPLLMRRPAAAAAAAAVPQAGSSSPAAATLSQPDAPREQAPEQQTAGDHSCQQQQQQGQEGDRSRQQQQKAEEQQQQQQGHGSAAPAKGPKELDMLTAFRLMLQPLPTTVVVAPPAPGRPRPAAAAAAGTRPGAVHGQPSSTGAVGWVWVAAQALNGARSLVGFSYEALVLERGSSSAPCPVLRLWGKVKAAALLRMQQTQESGPTEAAAAADAANQQRIAAAAGGKQAGLTGSSGLAAGSAERLARWCCRAATAAAWLAAPGLLVAYHTILAAHDQPLFVLYVCSLGVLHTACELWAFSIAAYSRGVMSRREKVDSLICSHILPLAFNMALGLGQTMISPLLPQALEYLLFWLRCLLLPLLAVWASYVSWLPSEGLPVLFMMPEELRRWRQSRHAYHHHSSSSSDRHRRYHQQQQHYHHQQGSDDDDFWEHHYQPQEQQGGHMGRSRGGPTLAAAAADGDGWHGGPPRAAPAAGRRHVVHGFGQAPTAVHHPWQHVRRRASLEEGGAGLHAGPAPAGEAVHWPPPLVVPPEVEELLEEVPDVFRCPITLSIMREPAQTSSGITYERQAILDWLNICRHDPVTHAPLRRRHLSPNLSLRQLVERWVEQKKQELTKSKGCEDGNGAAAGLAAAAAAAAGVLRGSDQQQQQQHQEAVTQGGPAQQQRGQQQVQQAES